MRIRKLSTCCGIEQRDDVVVLNRLEIAIVCADSVEELRPEGKPGRRWHCSWEDLSDHGSLRCDVAMQTAVGVEREVASAPTLCRPAKRADQRTAWRLHEVMVEQLIASFKAAPEELVLDFDATDNSLHGQQEGRFFHGYYDCYCCLPLYVFCGQQLLWAYCAPAASMGPNTPRPS